MLKHPERKYRPFASIELPDRRWPSRRLEAAPRWCSTDLRDGNQALIEPMGIERKRQFFDLLVRLGYKEIEIAFPAASQTDFSFVRGLIDGGSIPDDVWIQVITQAREDLIRDTLEALRGAPRAIVHLYNATAPVFRELVFSQGRQATIDMAVSGTRLIRELCEAQPETEWIYQYSPETFCFTEPEFALEICEAVCQAWQPSAERPLILNLPATVEVATPNVYADQIEWFMRHFSDLSHITISVHPHNDRGTGVACAEQAQLAGAARVEGCLFGNGERTGNVDLVTLALNLYTQGIDPGVDFSDMAEVVRVVESCNQLPVHPRHPYAGELVFTAFSGSHQDAIRKGFAARASDPEGCWQVPYLPLDPVDVGASYEAVIRVNSQSGKGGVAWLLEQDHGLRMPRRLQMEFSRLVQRDSDASGRELDSARIWQLFRETYGLHGTPLMVLGDYRITGAGGGDDPRVQCFEGLLCHAGHTLALQGHGGGVLESVVDSLRGPLDLRLDIVDYQEHSLGGDTESRAVAYVECRDEDGNHRFGVAVEGDSTGAAIRALLGAAARLLTIRQRT
ncbi:2-isopropylmalate synthase [Halomonas organivorans]|uniref:2-isopropylmalate synthase n=1 Tax=Halomonas organivorans TaxID=257772 RepID=A0A7W5G740_9GAMM|nr:2-isopropylmalate synthase [Halomonas organivorans]MBB3143208.1 2-isopropylmalate synthase [Halomonas organivorans]